MQQLNTLSQQATTFARQSPLLAYGGLAAASVAALYGFRMWAAGGVCNHVVDLTGKNVVITGGNSGIGKETAKVLATMGANVVIAGRNRQLCEKAVKDLKEETKSNNIEFVQLDLADLESIRKFADEIKKRNFPIHILLNNAGVMAAPLTRTKDGFEMQIGTNHLGHFLLTNLLFDNLAKNNARVVNVSSMGHYAGKIDFNSFRGDESTYSAWSAYYQSKLANVLFTNELQRKFQAKGSKATANSLHPGVINTELGRHMNPVLNKIATSFMALFGKTIPQGAQTSIYCCIAPELEGVGGKYFSDCKEKKPNALALDVNLAEKFWTVSEDMVGLSSKKSN